MAEDVVVIPSDDPSIWWRFKAAGFPKRSVKGTCKKDNVRSWALRGCGREGCSRGPFLAEKEFAKRPCRWGKGWPVEPLQPIMEEEKEEEDEERGEELDQENQPLLNALSRPRTAPRRYDSTPTKSHQAAELRSWAIGGRREAGRLQTKQGGLRKKLR